MNSNRRVPPVWLMGLSNATLGFSTGMVFFVLPQLMAAEHIPELRIAALTAVAMSPNFWAVLLSPILDVRFSRRWYATVFATAAAISASVAILNLRHLVVLETAMVLCVTAAALSGAALGGWLSNITDPNNKNTLSKWMNIALIGGTGAAAMLGTEVVHHLPVVLASALLGGMILLPAAISWSFLRQGRTGDSQRKVSANSIARFWLCCAAAKSWLSHFFFSRRAALLRSRTYLEGSAAIFMLRHGQ